MSSQIFLAANQSLDILLSIFGNFFFLEVSTGYFILKLMIKNHGLSCLPSMVLISIESLNVLRRCLILFCLPFKDKQSYGNFNTLSLFQVDSSLRVHVIRDGNYSHKGIVLWSTEQTGIDDEKFEEAASIVSCK